MPKTTASPFVTIKTKYQVTLPTSIRKEAKLSVGDILEAKVEGKKITLSPKSIIDRELALALENVKAGRLSPIFNTAEAAIAYLHRAVKIEQKKGVSRKS
jgi:AbrB family looped-hinge helix DNA binding protein